jgi:hypothetical protein
MFWFSCNGTNGGQTGVSPISIDATISSVSPFDVKLSDFAGGAISAITVQEQIILKDLLTL